jgi:hypothetical protein
MSCSQSPHTTVVCGGGGLNQYQPTVADGGKAARGSSSAPSAVGGIAAPAAERGALGSEKRAVAWSDMRERERKQLLSDVEELRRLLADYSTETIVGACTAYWLKRGSIDDVFQDLGSPAKQWSFLLGLMLTSPEPAEPKKFAERTFERGQELLNKIFLAYA